MPIPTEKAYAKELDTQDTLAGFRERFYIPDPDLIYLDGNSLGRPPEKALEIAADLTASAWGNRLIRAWGEGWLNMPEHIGGKLAQLLGAKSGEIIIADSTSTNLFKLVVAALQFQQGRTKIITDDLNFPSDIYILEGAIKLLGEGHQLEIVPSPDGIHGPVEEIITQIDEHTALVTLSLTAFKSGYTYDLPTLTRAAHDAGAFVLWDLSHSAGAVPIDLNAAHVDLAVGCTYKYLNGGPGAPAYLYIREDLQNRLDNPIPGWMGSADMFDFNLSYNPDPTLRHFITSTPPIVSMALIEPGVDLLLEAGMEAVREKSVKQTEYLIGLWEAMLKDLGFTLNSPADPARRGSHVSIGHPEGLGIDLALIHEMNVIPDFREPDNIRLGFAPLYTTFTEIHETVMRLQKIVTEKLHKKYDQDRPTVT
jgi:kynureninase